MKKLPDEKTLLAMLEQFKKSATKKPPCPLCLCGVYYDYVTGFAIKAVLP